MMHQASMSNQRNIWQTLWSSVKPAVPLPTAHSTTNPVSNLAATVTELFGPGELDAQRQRIRYGVLTSSLSFGLAMAGSTLFAPLRYASLATLCMMGVPPAKAAYDGLQEEGKLTNELAETLLLAVCLSQGYLLAGSLIFSLYYGGLALGKEWEKKSGEAKLELPKVARVQQNNQVIEKAVNTLCNGEIILLDSGQLLPVDGIIASGRAVVDAQPFGNASNPVLVQVDASVQRGSLVVVGKVTVRVKMM